MKKLTTILALIVSIGIVTVSCKDVKKDAKKERLEKIAKADASKKPCCKEGDKVKKECTEAEKKECAEKKKECTEAEKKECAEKKKECTEAEKKECAEKKK